MSESYEVDVAALADHARRLSTLADDLRSVLDGAVSLPDDAFGETGRAAAVALEALGQAGQDTVRAGSDGLAAESTKVRDAATAYEHQEADTKAGLSEAGEGLGSPGSEVPSS
ncbi:hypothetical protein [Actinocrispum sp. NPDC049592]|uniref:hypothetical protein n=1 Tax=Actinocrispum sp. NPDC049592 TaxID=3154835 RepID=UPI003424C7FA